MAGLKICALCILFVPAADALNVITNNSERLAGGSTYGQRRFFNQLYQQSLAFPTNPTSKYVPGSDGTYSQNYQDKWIAAVAQHNGWDKQDGFFFDLGAFHGLKCSNTALVEKKFGWKGICVEPRPVAGAFSERSCQLVTRALSDVTGEEKRFYGIPGTQLQHIHKYPMDRATDNGEIVKTLSMLDLLDCVNRTDGTTQKKCEGVPGSMQIPSFVNFVSIDVEMQGLNVLKTFPFDKVKVGAWVIEQEAGHDAAIDATLKQNGYMLVPVQNPGVDRYFINPKFWTPALAKKDWRIHPATSEC